MSDDIVARLRNAKWTDDEVFGDAADEIERLTAELSIAYEAQGEMAKREDEVAAVIGAEYLLDPPDGGDVSLAEGVGRIKAERDALRAELAAEREQRSRYQRIAAELTDRLNGTPCAEIRWQQERDALRALLREVRGHLDDAGVRKLLASIDAALKGDGE